MLTPTDCIEADFHTKWYKKWAQAIGYPVAKHPKFWEGAYIAQALDERGCLKAGKKGLGMGTGQEQLAALFASEGAYVTATDQDPDSDQATKWDNGQLSKGLTSLYYPHIIGKDDFDSRVTYKSYDMNDYEPQFKDNYDFIWHNCVVGHLGSMEKSVAHLESSADYLVDGGWLVFTTELNIGSLDETVDRDSDTIIWRLKDLLSLFESLAEKGLKADRFTVRMGDHEVDTRVNTVFNHNTYENVHAELLDDPEHSEIKIPFGGFVLTQIALSFQKTGVKDAQKAMKDHRSDYTKNKETILRHLKKNKDLSMYFSGPGDNELQAANLEPEHGELNLVMKPEEERVVELKFKNKSNLYLFDLSVLKPHCHPPLVLATMDPINRESSFYTSTWSSPNRPCFTFSELASGESGGLWSHHVVKPSDDLKFSFTLTAPKKAGTYTESFVLVFEGRNVVMGSRVVLNIEVNSEPQVTKDAGTQASVEILDRLDRIERRLDGVEAPSLPVYIFMHLAKTGGTTFIGNVIKNLAYETEFIDLGPHGNKYRSEHDLPAIEDRSAASLDDVKVVCGHLVYYGVHDYFKGREARYFTFLREPVSRIISHYTFDSSKDEQSFDDWYANWAPNQMVLFYFDHLGVDSIDAVLTGVSKFWHVGFQDELDKSLHYVNAHIGLPDNYENRRVAGLDYNTVKDIGYADDRIIKSTYKPSQKQLNKVKEDNKLDIWLYEHIKAHTLFGKYIKPNNIDFPR